MALRAISSPRPDATRASTDHHHHTQRTVGGRVFLMHTSLPNCGAGTLRSREVPSAYGTTDELELFLPAPDAAGGAFWRDAALAAAAAKISFDVCTVWSGLGDVATVGAGSGRAWASTWGGRGTGSSLTRVSPLRLR